MAIKSILLCSLSQACSCSLRHGKVAHMLVPWALPLTHGDRVGQATPRGGDGSVVALGGHLGGGLAPHMQISRRALLLLENARSLTSTVPGSMCNLLTTALNSPRSYLEAQQLGRCLRPGDSPGASAVGFGSGHLERLAKLSVLSGVIGLHTG